MIVAVVEVHVKEENIEDFIQATVANCEQSIKEAGNCRFDFLQSKDDPSMFLVYEAYENDEQAAAHKKTDHYFAWRDTVAPWMAAPRKGTFFTSIKP